MKTRIISGAIIVAVVIGVLIAWSYFSPVAAIAACVLAGAAAYEALYKTGYNKNVPMVIAAVIYSVAVIWCYCGYIPLPAEVLSVAFAVIMIALGLKNHEGTDAAKTVYSIFMPVAMSYAFSCFAAILNFPDGFGLFYLLLLLNFSSISDCGAYFVGCAIGKHKLAPVLSPKKTIEGAVGGVASAVLFTAVIVLVYNAVAHSSIVLWPFLLATPLFSVLGMMGDIFFSYIKRCCGIKDYSNLIPGHGGILDRVDSILMIAPVLYLFLRFLVK